MQITVAVCTHNPDRKTFVRVLDAIVPQLAAVASAELIVIDNNSTPPLSERAFLFGYPISILREQTPGLTAAREAAVRGARGAVILFVDDDNVLAPGYLARVVREFEQDDSIGLLGGSAEPEYDSAFPTWAREFEPWLAVRRYDRGDRVVTEAPPYSEHFPVGAGMAVRRHLAEAYVDDAIVSGRIEGRRGAALSSGEDLDIGLFVLSRGSRLAVIGELRLVHVIGSARLRRDYLARLAASNVQSRLELENKWASRFGQPIFPSSSNSLLGLAARSAVATMLSPVSPRFAVKRRFFTAMLRARRGGYSP